MNDIIQTHSLTKFYGNARGIIELNLNVKQGEMFGFIGPNGAGKSTTIRTLLGLISPTSGSAEVFSKDIVKDKVEILSKIGYLPGETTFYSNMKVADVIKLSAKIRKKECTKEAEILCKRLQLDTTKKVEELSLGNRKKLGIVCALQHKPDLYILDEPTSGLDPLMQKEFFTILKERQSEGATIFLSSHVLSEIQRYCDRAAIIRDGKMIVCDSVEKLTETSAKRVTLHSVTLPPNIDGIKDIKSGENSVSFLYRGDIKMLLKRIIDMPVSDINISEPELDEIFMHFYERKGEQK